MSAKNSFTPSSAPAADKPLSSLQALQTRLGQLGIGWWGIHRSETKHLNKLLHPNESVGGAICGSNKSGNVMLVATDRRVIFIDRKPFFSKAEDISYEAIGGITFEWMGFTGLVILHTKLGDIKIKTYGRTSADIFHNYIDQRCIEQ